MTPRGTDALNDRTFDWSHFVICAVYTGLAWVLWAGLADNAVTSWGFGVTMALMTVWIATREQYPLSMMLGTIIGLGVAFPAMYAAESPLWVVGLVMILTAVPAPQVLVFWATRLVMTVRAKSRHKPVPVTS